MDLMDYLELDDVEDFYSISKEKLIGWAFKGNVSLAVRLSDLTKIDRIEIESTDSFDIKNFPFCGNTQFAYLHPPVYRHLNKTIPASRLCSVNKYPVGHSKNKLSENVYRVVNDYEYPPLSQKEIPPCLDIILTRDAILNSEFMMGALVCFGVFAIVFNFLYFLPMQLFSFFWC